MNKEQEGHREKHKDISIDSINISKRVFVVQERVGERRGTEIFEVT